MWSRMHPSACELVAEILQYVADSIRIKSPEADAMYAGS